jgi:heme A synthase
MTHVTTPANPARSGTPAHSRPVWQVSAFAGLTAAVATELYGLVARAAGVPMSAAGFGQTTAQPVTVGMFAMGTLLCTFLATILAIILARFVARPARAFAAATVVLTALSLAVPLSAADTAAATRLTLAGAHLLAAAIIIPTISRRLARPRGASQAAESSGA